MKNRIYKIVAAMMAGVVMLTLGMISPVQAAASDATIADPVFSISGGYYDDPVTITITCSTPNTMIYYINDETTDFARNVWDVYSGPIAITTNTTIRAIAIATDREGNSAIVKNYYTIGSQASGYTYAGVELGENVPVAVLTNDYTNLKYAVTTTAEWNEIDKGSKLEVTLKIDNAAKTISATDRALFAANLNGNTVAQYYDIGLYKKVASAAEVKVLSPNAGMNIQMVVPLEAFNTNVAVNRVYTMMYIFDGQVYSNPVFRTAEGLLYYTAPKSTVYALTYTDVPNGL